ncbi:MAG: hypothetical protein ACJ716_17480, partial [Marmoricola sp.]
MRIHPLLAATTAALFVAAVALATQPAHAQASAGQSTHAQRAIAALRAHGTDAHVDAHQGLKAIATIVDPDGTSHVRLQRTYRGLPVVGGDLVVHQAASGA